MRTEAVMRAPVCLHESAAGPQDNSHALSLHVPVLATGHPVDTRGIRKFHTTSGCRILRPQNQGQGVARKNVRGFTELFMAMAVRA